MYLGEQSMSLTQMTEPSLIVFLPVPRIFRLSSLQTCHGPCGLLSRGE